MMLKIDQFLKIISAVVIIMIAVGTTGQTGSHISSAQINNIIKIPCIGPEEKPQLPCPPPGKCLGPADEPIPCPKPGTKPGGGIETGCGGPNDICPQPNPTAAVSNNTISLQNISQNVLTDNANKEVTEGLPIGQNTIINH